jgi:transposase
VEDWAEIRRLYRAEGLSKAEIARRLGISWNTVAAAVGSDKPPRYQRTARPTLADEVEPQLRALLAQFPRMPATVIAERIGWPHSITVLKDRVREIRPEYQGVDPADRLVFEPGQTAQMDLWFPEPRIPVGHGQERVLPVLVMVLGFSRAIDAVMLPSRQGGDLTAGMWMLLQRLGRVPRRVVWDREAAIAGTGRPTTLAAGFFGTLGTGLTIAPARDPEFKGVVERANGYLETSFLPGRTFASPADFNDQLSTWLTTTANHRVVRRLRGRPVELLQQDRDRMIDLPAHPPVVGLQARTRLARDYYLRVDGNDYSVDPRLIGRFIDITATGTTVTFRHDGQPVSEHDRCWGQHQTITDPDHVRIAAGLRSHYQARQRQATSRRHQDGHPVQIRALTDYDALFGVDFHHQEKEITS